MMAAEGAKVTLTGRDGSALISAKSELIAVGADEADVLVVVGDFLSDGFHQKLIDETVAKFGRIDVLVNNAGGIPDGVIPKSFSAPLDHFDFDIHLNLKTPMVLSTLAAPFLARTKGAIVNISSISALHFVLNLVWIQQKIKISPLPYYAIAKAGLDQLTVQLAGELAPKGIRVNTIKPGYIHTTALLKHGIDPVTYTKIDAVVAQQLPLGRVGQPEDIGHAILFLADNNTSGFITGQSLVVDGGDIILKAVNYGFTDPSKISNT